MNTLAHARFALKSSLFIALLSSLSNASAMPPFEYRLLPVDICRLPDIQDEDVECCICQLVNQPGPVQSCLDAKGDVGQIGDKVVCKMPPRELLGKPQAKNKQQTPNVIAQRPPSEAEDGRVWRDKWWKTSTQQPPPLYPNDYPEEAKNSKPPAGVFHPTEEEAKRFKSLHVRERAQKMKLKKPPFGYPPPVESIRMPPPHSLPTDPTNMDSKE
jgi:hypothetical protein